MAVNKKNEQPRLWVYFGFLSPGRLILDLWQISLSKPDYWKSHRKIMIKVSDSLERNIKENPRIYEVKKYRREAKNLERVVKKEVERNIDSILLKDLKQDITRWRWVQHWVESFTEGLERMLFTPLQERLEKDQRESKRSSDHLIFELLSKKLEAGNNTNTKSSRPNQVEHNKRKELALTETELAYLFRIFLDENLFSITKIKDLASFLGNVTHYSTEQLRKPNVNNLDAKNFDAVMKFLSNVLERTVTERGIHLNQ